MQPTNPPALPTRKSRPMMSLSTLAWLLAGLVAGVALEWWRGVGRAALLGEASVPGASWPHAA